MGSSSCMARLRGELTPVMSQKKSALSITVASAIDVTSPISSASTASIMLDLTSPVSFESTVSSARVSAAVSLVSVAVGEMPAVETGPSRMVVDGWTSFGVSL